MRIALASSLLALLALAGCSDGGDETPAPAGPVDANGEPLDAAPQVIKGTGTITASGPVLSLGDAGIPFGVGANVTLLYAEIVWSDPVQDIDLALASPAAGTTGTAQNFDIIANGGSPGAPDSPHSLTVANPAQGEWQASAFANGAAAMLEYDVAITLFHGETAVPPGYTALG